MDNKISFQSIALSEINVARMFVNLLIEKYQDSENQYTQTVLTGYRAAKVYLDNLCQMSDQERSFSPGEVEPIALAFRDVADIFFTISENRNSYSIESELDDACQYIGGLLAGVSEKFKSEMVDIKQVA